MSYNPNNALVFSENVVRSAVIVELRPNGAVELVLKVDTDLALSEMEKDFDQKKFGDMVSAVQTAMQRTQTLRASISRVTS